MAKVVTIQVHELIDMVGNKARGFGMTFYPETNGADGVIRTENNSAKPEWKPTGPYNSKGKGVEIKHLWARRDKIIVNDTYVYDRAGFIAVEAPILNEDFDAKPDEGTLKSAALAILAHSMFVNGKQAVKHAGLDNIK